MIDNEYADYVNTSSNNNNNTGISATTKHQKPVDSEAKSSSRIIEDIRQSDFKEHNMLLYPDLPSYRQIYSECTKQALDNNEIVFLATTYDSFDRIYDALRSKGISVDNEMKDGNLIIVDAVKAYQIDTYGAMKLVKSLVMRAAIDGKAGVFNLSDMGSFFLAERTEKLIEYEQSVPKKLDLKFMATCSYHKGNFATLTNQQQKELLSSHNTVMQVKN
jgi:hypothetical protein